MIHKEATIRYAGYNPDDLTPKSNKRICVVCDECSRVRWIQKSAYRDLCFECAMSKRTGKNHSMYGRDQSGKKNGMWRGGKKIIFCDCCNREIERHLCDIHKHNFCSNKCFGKCISNNDEWKQKISQANKGNKPTKEQIEKIKESWKDIKFHSKFCKICNKKFIPNCGSQIYCENCRPEDWRDWDRTILLNEQFPGCARHHITEFLVICIPDEIHRFYKHNLNTQQNLKNINLFAWKFLLGLI